MLLLFFRVLLFEIKETKGLIEDLVLNVAHSLDQLLPQHRAFLFIIFISQILQQILVLVEYDAKVLPQYFLKLFLYCV